MIAIKVEIPLYLVKFINVNYGVNFIAQRNTDLGLILTDFLQKDTVKQKFGNPKDVYTFYVTKNIAQKHGYFISAEKNIALVKRINTLFKIAMTTYVDISVKSNLMYSTGTKRQHKQSRYVAYQQFLNFHNITEDDLKFESVYRNDVRRRDIKERYNQPILPKKEVPKTQITTTTTVVKTIETPLKHRRKLGHKTTTTKTTTHQLSIFA